MDARTVLGSIAAAATGVVLGRIAAEKTDEPGFEPSEEGLDEMGVLGAFGGITVGMYLGGLQIYEAMQEYGAKKVLTWGVAIPAAAVVARAALDKVRDK